MPSCCVCRLPTIHEKCFSSLRLSSHPISILFGFFERARAFTETELSWVNISCGSAVRHCVLAPVIFSCILVFDDWRRGGVILVNPGISGVFLKTGPGTPLGVASLNLNLNLNLQNNCKIQGLCCCVYLSVLSNPAYRGLVVILWII